MVTDIVMAVHQVDSLTEWYHGMWYIVVYKYDIYNTNWPFVGYLKADGKVCNLMQSSPSLDNGGTYYNTQKEAQLVKDQNRECVTR